jgi:UDP-N-acetyl-L-fucosamine synthase
MKVLTVVGTRPEIIRLSRIIALLDKVCIHKLVHTGQNYDYELNKLFFDDLEIRKPDYFLEVKADSLGAMIANIIAKIENVILSEEPDALLILGDTNSALSSIIAKRYHIPIYHMEAGNRCFDQNVPEEINRKIIDHISDFNLVYTEHARRNLISEGIHPRYIYLTGSPMKEIIDYYYEKVERSDILSKLDIEKGNYFVVSLHREENVDSKNNLNLLLQVLKFISDKYKKKVIVSTHPRTRDRMQILNINENLSNVYFLKPFGFFDYLKLQQCAYCTLSDSGTISEEAAILKFPAVTLRNAMERPEAMDSGNIIITGLNKDVICNSIEYVTSKYSDINIVEIPKEYEVLNCADRVVRLIIGTYKLINRWQGIDAKD